MGQALGYEPVSMEDDFFDNGGESLIATRLVSVIRKHFEIELPLHRIPTRWFSTFSLTGSGIYQYFERLINVGDE